MTAPAMLAEIDGIGRDPIRGGHSRHLFDDADRELRDWFVSTAKHLGLEVERDGNANLWAWWHPAAGPRYPAVITGSHLDSVPGGGALDGPLGVVSALEAVSRLRAAGHEPARSVAVVVFAEEEGARFGVACLGSRLLTGVLPAEKALELTDSAGHRLREVLAGNGVDPSGVGADAERLARIGAVVELHVEQGKQLAPLGRPLGLATTILAHGRWSLRITGRGDHAGSTELSSRRDPVVVAADVIKAVRQAAVDAPPQAHARATVGRLSVTPGGTNAIASEVVLWLDARAERDEEVRDLVSEVSAVASTAAAAEGCTVAVQEESFSSRVAFDGPLTDRLDRVLGGIPRIPTGAGHDAGVLAAFAPSAMLFVRNPEGVSHAPAETASDADIARGVTALAACLAELT
ncbi:Zn-dependent hydrolase [Actinoplanes ianthinogenes]|uniref:Zn-dependent hydrolase n=2 Tax=Actinoplanes ianthinogenes TaxID=122358 RepID=A0ABM7MA23_9ACTN|nr:Zn-dependent hydrolase [Actinoplanes ianthinogenes]GGR36834.1 Zn-dependent hydrolase [Actinoplanes ianthinogenes]